MFSFFKAMLKMPTHWVIWVMMLMGVNFVMPLLFWSSIEAKVTLLAMVLGAMIQLVIFKKLGFVRLLGIGHFPWIFLVLWLFFKLETPLQSFFEYWILSVIVMNSLSLVIDTFDVGRWLRGERRPTIT